MSDYHHLLYLIYQTFYFYSISKLGGFSKKNHWVVEFKSNNKVLLTFFASKVKEKKNTCILTWQPKFPWSDETNLCLDSQVQKGVFLIKFCRPNIVFLYHWQTCRQLEENHCYCITNKKFNHESLSQVHQYYLF